MWTKAQEEELRMLRLSGMEWNDIDKHFGKSRGCSFGKGKRMGLTKSQDIGWTDEHAHELVRLRETMTLKECAEILGFKYDFIKKRSQEIFRETGVRAVVNKTVHEKTTFVYDDFNDLESEYIESGQLYFDYSADQ